MGQIVFLYFIQKKGWLGVQAFPVRLTDKEYKRALFRNAKAYSLIEKIYSQPDSDGIYRIDQRALFALSDEDAKFVSTLVNGKAWGDGPKNFMRSLYESCVKRGKNYFDDYLEPLFYEALNVNRGENGFYARFHCRVPFLNGGLFEQLDNYDWVNSDFHIPNEMFSNVDIKGKDEANGILDIFDRYNFTMAEDEPMEREVAIDPEMLGKVFENLLDVKDRKSKGAFYTPREIVHYMCQESLINYLATNTGIDEEDIRKFILYGEYFRDSDCLKTKEIYKNGKRSYTIDKERDMEMPESIFSFKANVNRLKEIDELLENVKIADPAVGSGAFLLGLLNEIVRARQTLTAYMAIEMNGFQRLNFYAYGRKTYDLKVNTIKNCLFACDLEPSATDITKLRLWLSIVIDDETVKQDNSGGMLDVHTDPRQLPNLDCNVICGNSLIDEFSGIQLITESSLLNNQAKVGMDSFYQFGFDNMLNELIKLQDELYFTKDHESKREIKEKIHNIYDRIILHQLSGSQDAVKKYQTIKNESCQPFILWQLYFPKVFRENQGFDIVIGNPPYIDSEGMVNAGLDWERDYISKNYKYAKGNWDIYIAFFEKGMNLLNNVGSLMYITPDKWISKPFGDGLRTAKYKNIKQIMAAGRDVFESALVDSIVTMFTANEHDNIDVFTKANKDDDITFFRSVNKEILSKPYTLDIVFSEYVNIVEKMNIGRKIIIDKYECENACATSDCYTLKEILYSLEDKVDYNESNMFKVINTGTIGKYVSRWGSSPMKYLKDKYQYPYVYKNEFAETFPKSYGQKPKKKKLIIKGLTLLDATIDTKGEIVPGKSTLVLCIENSDELKLIGTYINSKISMFYIKQKYSSSSYNGGITFTKHMINNLPLPNLSDDDKQRLIILADKIIMKKNNDISANVTDLEKEIDKIYYNSFNLSDKEINIIEEIL